MVYAPWVNEWFDNMLEGIPHGLAIHGGASYMMSKTQHCQVSSLRLVLVSAHRREIIMPADPAAVLAVSTPSRCINGEVPVLSEEASGALNRKMSCFLCFCRLYFFNVRPPCRSASDFAPIREIEIVIFADPEPSQNNVQLIRCMLPGSMSGLIT